MVVYTVEQRWGAGKYCNITLNDSGERIIFSDEAQFVLGRYVNQKNCRIWGTENTYAFQCKPTHPQRVTIGCGFWSRCIIGPFFFENEQEEAVTFNVDPLLTERIVLSNEKEI